MAKEIETPRLIAHGRMFFKDWSMPDPTSAPLHAALHAARYGLPTLTQTQAYSICEAASAYLHLAAHPADTASIIAQLRAVRGAVRRSEREERCSRGR